MDGNQPFVMSQASTNTALREFWSTDDVKELNTGLGFGLES